MAAGVRLSEASMSQLMERLACSSKLGDALRVAEQMRKLGHAPDVHSLETLLTATLADGRLTKSSLKALGYAMSSPGEGVYVTVLQSTVSWDVAAACLVDVVKLKGPVSMRLVDAAVRSYLKLGGDLSGGSRIQAAETLVLALKHCLSHGALVDETMETLGCALTLHLLAFDAEAAGWTYANLVKSAPECQESSTRVRVVERAVEAMKIVDMTRGLKPQDQRFIRSAFNDAIRFSGPTGPSLNLCSDVAALMSRARSIGGVQEVVRCATRSHGLGAARELVSTVLASGIPADFAVSMCEGLSPQLFDSNCVQSLFQSFASLSDFHYLTRAVAIAQQGLASDQSTDADSILDTCVVDASMRMASGALSVRPGLVCVPAPSCRIVSQDKATALVPDCALRVVLVQGGGAEVNSLVLMVNQQTGLISGPDGQEWPDLGSALRDLQQ